jgi:nucleoside-diphosphate-sugar epimerase
VQVLVTGAAGLVGGHLVARLLERGDRVRALVLDAGEAARVSRPGVDVHVADLAAAADLAPALDGTDAIVHCAGVVRLTAPPSEFFAVNVGGMERLLAAACRVRVGRFVHLSSVSVYGHAAAPVSEDAPKRPLGAYGQSKWAAEQLLWRHHAQEGLPAVALRPCPIYGPGDRRVTAAIRTMGRLRAVPLPHAGRRLIDLVYVSDVADAAVAALDASAVGRAYNITDGEAHSYRDVLDAHAQAVGRRPRIVPVPLPALLAAMRLGMAWRRWRGAPAGFDQQLERARGLGLDAHYSIDAARRDLGYRPAVGIVEGLRRTLRGESG